jgi:tellurite resistance protein
MALTKEQEKEARRKLRKELSTQLSKAVADSITRPVVRKLWEQGFTSMEAFHMATAEKLQDAGTPAELTVAILIAKERGRYLRRMSCLQLCCVLCPGLVAPQT